MNTSQLAAFGVPGLPLIRHGDDLSSILLTALEAADLDLLDGDIVVVAQKIISKAEGRTRRLSEVEPTPRALELATATDKEPAMVQLILDESRQILRHRIGVLIVEHKLGFILANAGIDRSNVDADSDQVLLLPVDPNASEARLRAELGRQTGKELGVIITDSVGRAWRMGTTGMALGSAGVEALLNLRGRKDLFGRELQVSEHAVADSVASTAELLMGEANEALPIVIVRGLQAGHSNQDATVLIRPEQDDLFR